jgi:large subunit ribosomal protein L1
MRDNVLQAIKNLRENSQKRNFSQTFDMIISLKEFDVKKPENKFSEDIVLPRGRGKPANIIVFGDTVKNLDCKIINSNDIQDLAKNKRELKKMVSQSDFFLAEPSMMPVIGKLLGQILAPRGKMPKLVGSDVSGVVKNLKNSVRIKVKDTPIIQCLVGKDNMKDEDVLENIESILNHLEAKLPKGKHNIKEVLLKLTMSKPVKVM